MRVSDLNSDYQNSNTKNGGTTDSTQGESFDQLFDKVQQGNEHSSQSHSNQGGSAQTVSTPGKSEPAASLTTDNNYYRYRRDAVDSSKSDFMVAVEQALRDNMLGIDREKIEEIEEQMEVVKADNSLTNEEKTKKLDDLQQQIDSIIEAAVERTKEKLTEESLYGNV
ncbi:MAG: hypothetical protein KUG78_02695 [Kangiellaceae bacterium]|nr:hypothetical protein [Kangiellaceae bacterium]